MSDNCTRKQQETIDNLQFGITVQVDENGKIHIGEQPRMDWYNIFVKATKYE